MVIDGEEGCLTGDTLVQISRGKVSRTYTLKRLFNHYNGNPDGIIPKDKNFDLSIPSYVRSYNGKDIRLHKLKDVVYSGKKEIALLELENGKSIKATLDHEFLTREGWKTLGDIKLKGNQELMCDTLHSKKSGRRRIKLYDISLRVYHHPYSTKNRVEVHRLIYEANLNKIHFLEFLDILLNESDKAKKLKYVDPKKFHIHHRDGNHYNNSVENLELIKKKDHLKYHGVNGYTNFSQGIPVFSKVKKIKVLGIEAVYDIKCEEPYHNFVANGIIVHNCGKSTLACQIARFVDPTFTEERMCLKPEEFIEQVNSCYKQAIVFDEAFTGLASRRAMTLVNTLMVELMMEMRKKNLFIILCLPSVFYLEKYVCLHRARGLLHCFLSRGKPGQFMIYNQNQLKMLYLKGKLNMSYYFPRVDLKGSFYPKYPIDWEAYEKRKIAALKHKEVDKKTAKQIAQRDVFIYELWKSGMSQKKISELAKESYVSIGKTTIADAISRHESELKQRLMILRGTSSENPRKVTRTSSKERYATPENDDAPADNI